MYKFDWNLLENLTKITGTKNADLKKDYGCGCSTWYRWIRLHSISVSSLVDLLNRVHISISHFLITDDATPTGWNGLITPSDQWSPITWHNERIGNLYGNGKWAIAPTPHALSKMSKLSDQHRLTRWETNPDMMRVLDFVEFLNILKLDARLFVEDNNGVIKVPQWDYEPQTIPAITVSNEHVISGLQNDSKLKDKRIANLNIKALRLGRENMELRSVKQPAENTQYGLAKESPTFSGYGLFAKGYNFHIALLKKIPELFVMTERDFRLRFGLHTNTLRSGENIKVSKLIDICNYFRISICHFFPPKSEPLVVHDRYYYEISPRVFIPIENKSENLKYIFGKYSIYGYSMARRTQTGSKNKAYRSEIKSESLMAVTLADICTKLNIPPTIFLKDENKKGYPPYATSNNETLIRNAIDMMKEIEILREKLRKVNYPKLKT